MVCCRSKRVIVKFLEKFSGESQSLELANREAEALAVSNAIFKIKQEMNAIKKSIPVKEVQLTKVGKKGQYLYK